MGVPGYYARLKRSVPRGGLRTAPPADVSSLSVDFNCMVHMCAGGLAPGRQGDADLIDAVVEYLARVVAAVGPSAELFVATDGVPPVAKMMQQRERRWLAEYRRRQRPAGASPSFDRNRITPGTPFMAELDARMRAAVAAIGGGGLRAVYSGSDERGEGEQKIMERLRAGGGAGTAVIYGLDGDLLNLCSLWATERPRGAPVPWVTRESDGAGGPLVYVHGLAAAAALAGLPVADPLNADASDPAVGDAVRSHVLAGFLCGNDFLPPLGCMSVRGGGLERLRALGAGGSLVSRSGAGADVAWGELARVLGGAAETEDRDFARADAEYWSARPPRDDGCDPEEREWRVLPLRMRNPRHASIRPGEDVAWRRRYYSVLFGARCGDTVRRATEQYLAGLQWTWDYYRGAWPPSEVAPPPWFYPFHYGPTAADLHNACMGIRDAGAPREALLAMPRADPSPAALLRFVLPPGDDDPPSHLTARAASLATYLRTRVWEARLMLPTPTDPVEDIV